MSSNSIETVKIIEIDIPYCSLTYGTGSCAAVLGTTGLHKCFNTFYTCQDKDNFDKTTLTIRFIEPRASIPIGSNFFPVLMNVSDFSSSVNIAGSNPKLGNLGRRARVTATFKDFPYHDRLTDKYASERVSGTAQDSGVGYDPTDRRTFFTKLRVRLPNYAKAPVRIKTAYIQTDTFYLLTEAGDFLTDESGNRLSWKDSDATVLEYLDTRNFIWSDFDGPDEDDNVTLEFKDVLTLAEKESAVAPLPSSGYLESDITDSDTSITLTPPGIVASSYPSSGLIVIGNELMTYTVDSGDTLNVTRATNNTEAASHSADDVVQIALQYTNQTIAQVLDDLLGTYTDIDASYIDSANYASEVSRWAPNIKLNTIIVKPTAVSDLLSELSVLGVSLWWDDVNAKIKMKLNHPKDLTETYVDVSDDTAIKKISQEDRDEERLTQIHFYSVSNDYFDSVDDQNRYDRVLVTVDTEAEGTNAFNDTRIREVFCRWIDQGDDATVRILSRRLLQRFNRAPQYFNITLDSVINPDLADILRVTSRVVTNDIGEAVQKELQVVQKSEPKSGQEVRIVAQSYEFSGRYGYIMPNSTSSTYSTASDDEKATGCYLIAEANDTFSSDSQPSYKLI